MSDVDYSLETNATKAWKAEDKPVIGTFCCHIPEELIHAAGALPVRIRATGAKDDSLGELYQSTYSCSFARCQLQYIIDGTYDFLDGIIGTNGCMQAQRVYDNAFFVDGKDDTSERFHYLYTTPRLKHERGFQFYLHEMKLFKEELEKQTGNEITEEKLKESIKVFNETRRLIKELYEFRKSDKPVITGSESLQWTLAALSMPKEQFNVELAAFLEELKTREPLEGYRARILLVGSAVDDPEYVKLLEDQGGLIVGDVNCFGSRSLWEEIEIDGDLYKSIANMYLNRPACPRLSDIHEELTEFIVNKTKELDVDGVILVWMRNCDPWGGEKVFFQAALEKMGIPLLELEKEEITVNAGQVAVRTEAFIEMIEEEA